jgi:hypothetical protein
LWREETSKDYFQLLLFEGTGVIFFLWSFRWVDGIYLRLMDYRWSTGAGF